MFRTFRAVRFLFVGPFVLVMLIVINRMTDPGNPWWRYAALGIGIVWVISLFRVLQAIVMVGGLAALGTWLWRRGSQPQQRPGVPPSPMAPPSATAPPPPPDPGGVPPK